MSSLIRGRLRPWLYLALTIGVGCASLLARLDVATPAGAQVSKDDIVHRVYAQKVAAPAAATHWITAWGAATQGPSPASALSERGFRRQTLREIVFSTAAGTEIRVRLSNVFGNRALHVGGASVGLQSSGAAVTAGTLRRLYFFKHRTVVVKPGTAVLSDPVRLRIKPLSRLAVSIYVSRPTGPATEHSDSREVSFVAAGKHGQQPGAAGYRRRIGDWYFLDSVQTLSPRRDLGAVVTLGDSITAGVGSSLGSDASWPDDLARRLNSLPDATLSVVDEGIGGNRVLNDAPCCGISAVSRFAFDVGAQTGARDVILLEGINDLGFSQKHDSLSAPHTSVSASQIAQGDRQIIAQAHRDGLRIFGATLTPFKGGRYWTPAAESKREAINHWILHSGAFDGVINFAAAVAEPADPLRLKPAYDYGDHLHLNNAGYHAMADAVDLNMLVGG